MKAEESTMERVGRMDIPFLSIFAHLLQEFCRFALITGDSITAIPIPLYRVSQMRSLFRAMAYRPGLKCEIIEGNTVRVYITGIVIKLPSGYVRHPIREISQTPAPNTISVIPNWQTRRLFKILIQSITNSTVWRKISEEMS